MESDDQDGELSEGVCRCCLKREIFNEGYNTLDSADIEDSKTLYSDMLISCFSVNMTFYNLDIRENFICDLCIAKLKNAYTFKALVEHSLNEWTKLVAVEQKSQTDEECTVRVGNVEILEVEKVDAECIIVDNVCEQGDYEIVYLDQYFDAIKSNKESQKQYPSNPLKAMFTNKPIAEKRYCKNKPKITKNNHNEQTSQTAMKILMKNEKETQPCDDPDQTSASAQVCGSESVPFEVEQQEVNTEPIVDSLKPTYFTNFNMIKEYSGKTIISKKEWRQILYSKICLEKKQCRICKETFNHVSLLVAHLNNHFPVYTCSVCKKAYSTRPSIKMHILSHDFSTEYKCDQCNQVFVNKTKYRYHIHRHNTNLRSYYCRLCPERFRDSYNKAMHMKAVHNAPAKPYKCKQCDQKFPVIGKLNTHVRKVHLNERTQMCSECGRSFFSKRDLKEHMFYNHGGEPFFKCEVCQKGFVRLYHYRHHIKSHKKDD